MPEDSTREDTPDQRTIQPGAGSLFRTSALIAAASLIGRLLGFAGDAVKSYYFGAGGRVDAFNVAAAVPTVLNDLLIQSLVNSAYIPVLSRYQTARDQLWRLSNALLNLTSLLVAILVLLMELFAPLLAHLLNGGASAEMQALTANLMQMTIPALFILNFSGIVSALLYARQRVLLPTAAGALLNGVIVISALLLQARLGIFALTLGLLLGALLQVAVQLYGLRETAWPYRPIFWHPDLRRIAGLYLPILAGLLLEIFLSRPLTYALASQTGEGGIAWMGYALTLRQAPEGLIATALSITVLVRLSAIAPEKSLLFHDTLAEGLRLAFVLIIPATLGLFLLARPVTALLFEHGSFAARDTEIVAQALRWYLAGLPFATVDLLLVVAFYAHRNTLTPALIGAFTTLAYVGLSKTLLPVMGLYSLMLADSARFVLHASVSAYFLFHATDGLSNRSIFSTLWKALLAAAVMGLAVSAAAGLTSPGGDTGSKALAVVIPTLTGLLIYLVMLTILGTDDLRLVRRVLSGPRRSQGSQNN